MKKCISGRQTSKTEKLIRLSAEKQIPILAINEMTKRSLKKKASDMGLNIPEPILVYDVMSDNYMNKILSIDNIIIDDAEYVLRNILKMRKVISVEAISITTDDISDSVETN